MFRPQPWIRWASGLALVGASGCAGLHRTPSPHTLGGPSPAGAMGAPLAATSRPLPSQDVASPFVEPGGGIGRFLPKPYTQLKHQEATRPSRWVDPFVARSKRKASEPQVASLIPPRAPRGISQEWLDERDGVETLPVAIRVEVHPDDAPALASRRPETTRRLSARSSEPVAPAAGRRRVSSPGPEADREPEPSGRRRAIEPQASRFARPRPMPEVPREGLGFTLPVGGPTAPPEPAVRDETTRVASATAEPEPAAMPESPRAREAEALNALAAPADEPSDPQVVPSAMSPLDEAFGDAPSLDDDAPAPVASPLDPAPEAPAAEPAPPVTEASKDTKPVARAPEAAPKAASPAEVPVASAPADENPVRPDPEPLADLPLADAPDPAPARDEIAAEPKAEAPASEVASAPKAEAPADRIAIAPKVEAPSTPVEEPAPAEKPAEAEVAAQALPSPSPGSEAPPPPYVDPAAAAREAGPSGPLQARTPRPLPRPPLPSPNIAPGAPASPVDVATRRTGGVEERSAYATVTPSPSSPPVADRSALAEASPRPEPARPGRPRLGRLPRAGDALADMPSVQFPASYYSSRPAAPTGDDETRRASATTETAPTVKPRTSWRPRLFRRLFGE